MRPMELGSSADGGGGGGGAQQQDAQSLAPPELPSGRALCAIVLLWVLPLASVASGMTDPIAALVWEAEAVTTSPREAQPVAVDAVQRGPRLQPREPRREPAAQDQPGPQPASESKLALDPEQPAALSEAEQVRKQVLFVCFCRK
jgi:hypothetical protein